MSETEKQPLTDAEFTRRLKELNGNQSAMARELGVSVQAVAKRRKRLQKADAHAVGRAKVAVSKAAEKNAELAMAAGARSAKVDLQRGLDIMDLLIESNSIYNDILAEIRGEVTKRGKSNPMQRKQLLMVGDKMASLAKTYFDIQATLYNAKNAQIFIQAVLNVLQSVDTNIKREVLRQLGDTAAFFQTHDGNIPAA